MVSGGEDMLKVASALLVAVKISLTWERASSKLRMKRLAAGKMRRNTNRSSTHNTPLIGPPAKEVGHAACSWSPCHGKLEKVKFNGNGAHNLREGVRADDGRHPHASRPALGDALPKGRVAEALAMLVQPDLLIASAGAQGNEFAWMGPSP